MNIFFQFLEMLGVSASLETNPYVLFICCILVLSVFCMASFINILIYCVVLYITEHKLFLDKIAKYKLINKIIPIYRKKSLTFLIIEVFLFLFCLSCIILLCLQFVYKAMKTMS